MSDETTTTTTTETPPATPPAAPTRTDYVGLARASLEQRTQAPTPTDAPAQATPPAEEPSTSYADAVLGGKRAPEPPKTAEESPPLDGSDKSLARIVELDRGLREERRTIDEERRTLAAERERVASWAKAAELAQSGKRLDALAALGIDYADLAAEALGAQRSGGSEEYAKKIEELEAKLAELPKTYEEKLAEAEAKRTEAALNAWHAEHEHVIASAGDRWELLRDHAGTLGKRATDLVVDVMEAAYDKGETLTVEAAADMLERSLEKRLREQASPASKKARILGLGSPSVTSQQPPSADRTGQSTLTSTPSTVTASAASETAGTKPEDRSPEGYRSAAIELAARLRRP